MHNRDNRLNKTNNRRVAVAGVAAADNAGRRYLPLQLHAGLMENPGSVPYPDRSPAAGTAARDSRIDR